MVVGQPTAARRLDAGSTVGEIQSAITTDPLASGADRWDRWRST